MSRRLFCLDNRIIFNESTFYKVHNLSKFYVFNIDVAISEDLPPPLPERTPESFVLASEHSEYLFCFYKNTCYSSLNSEKHG